MLQCVAVTGNMGPIGQNGGVQNLCCSVLQCVAMCCSALQCVAVCCSERKHGSGRPEWRGPTSVLQCVTVCECVAVCCSVNVTENMGPVGHNGEVKNLCGNV